MKSFRTLVTGCVLACTALFSQLTWANVVIAGTRVVYNSADREVTIKMSNAGTLPALVQTWADKGNPKSTPETADAPFVIMPPIFRVEAGKSQTVRMTFTQADLPQDKESVFWLNVLDVPPIPKQANADQNFIQIAVRSRLKIFYRPSPLTGSPEEAANNIRWQLAPSANGKGFVLQGQNNSPYHVSLEGASIVIGNKEYRSEGGMILPESVLNFELKGLTSRPQGAVLVRYQSINDYGAPVPHEAALATAN